MLYILYEYIYIYILTDLQQDSKPSTKLKEQSSSTTNLRNTKSKCEINKSEGKKRIASAFPEVTGSLHSYYNCEKGCSISESDKLHNKNGGKFVVTFNHGWLLSDVASEDELGLHWLVYVENQGMFCLLCREHDTHQKMNKSKKWNKEPVVRMRRAKITEHKQSDMHVTAIKLQHLRSCSIIHNEVLNKINSSRQVLINAFSAIYWLAKNEIPNNKLVSLICLLERCGLEDMRFFNHRSRPSIREMFVLIGQEIKQRMLSQIDGGPYGLLADEVTDISVQQQLIVFVKFIDGNKADTKFLDCRQVTGGATAGNITDTIKAGLDEAALPIDDMKSFVSDGANVMVGRENGVAERLRRLKKDPSFINIHCVAHRLALACADSDEIKYLNDVALILKQLWQFFENSPKRTDMFVEIQQRISELHMSEEQSKKLKKKVRKACKSRWLSMEASVISALENYEALLHCLKELNKDATAFGLYKRMLPIKFLGALYILGEVLPVLASVSRLFQTNALNFSVIAPAIKACKASLQQIGERKTPTLKLQHDLSNGGSKASLEKELKQNDKVMLDNMTLKYTEKLQDNLDKRFSHVLPVLSAMSIFDPSILPAETCPEFTNYGSESIQTISEFFWGSRNKDELLAEWQNFKYQLVQMKSNIPSSCSKSTTPLVWMLQRVMGQKHSFEKFFPSLVSVFEILLTLPVTNAWPERGASAIKRIKTRLRNRLAPDILNALMQITINGPELFTKDSDAIVQASVDR